jgi:hypothetical protein
MRVNWSHQGKKNASLVQRISFSLAIIFLILLAPFKFLYSKKLSSDRSGIHLSPTKLKGSTNYDYF